jgi:hypothetical protein
LVLVCADADKDRAAKLNANAATLANLDQAESFMAQVLLLDTAIKSFRGFWEV